MQEHIADPKSYGIYIVDRRHIDVEGSVEQLSNFMLEFSKLNRRQRIIQRNRTERLSDLLDWRNLGIVSLLMLTAWNLLLINFSVNFQYYREARVKAIQAVYPDYVDEGSAMVRSTSFSYPRPLSAPPSPSSSRHTTPAPSAHGSDEEDSVDEEQELEELGLSHKH